MVFQASYSFLIVNFSKSYVLKYCSWEINVGFETRVEGFECLLLNNVFPCLIYDYLCFKHGFWTYGYMGMVNELGNYDFPKTCSFWSSYDPNLILWDWFLVLRNVGIKLFLNYCIMILHWTLWVCVTTSYYVIKPRGLWIPPSGVIILSYCCYLTSVVGMYTLMCNIV